MNTTRHLARGAFGAAAAAWLLLTGAAAAWAGPVPIGPEPARGGPPAGGTGGGGTSAWEVVSIGAVSAALAVAVTLLVTYAVLHHRATHRPAAA
jgi:hypothetical protein